MKTPHPVAVWWHSNDNDEHEPVALVPAANAQRHLRDYNADRGDGFHDLADLDAQPLTWDDYHSRIDTDPITYALLAYLSDTVEGVWEKDSTGGGCTAFVVHGLTFGRPSFAMVTAGDDATHPILGWDRSIAVGFYTEDGEIITDGVEYFGEEFNISTAPMTADGIADGIAEAFRTVGFIPTPLVI